MSSWFQSLKKSLTTTSNKISSGIDHIFYKKHLDKETLEELKELLIASDIGNESSSFIIQELSKRKFSNIEDIKTIKLELADIIEKILTPVASKIDFTRNRPHVVLICGVNGNGKTTSIGKIISQYTAQNLKVVVAACDTFRAAAGAQLKIWADRAHATFIDGAPNSDPASVAFKAFDYSKNNNVDILLIDTAGRLSNKIHLMEELSKIDRVLKKIDPYAPHDTILVLDATTGSNAITQVKEFDKAVKLTGIIITKLDGSAKAGIVIPIGQHFRIPIISIGIGEGINDLTNFNAKNFASVLVGLSE